MKVCPHPLPIRSSAMASLVMTRYAKTAAGGGEGNNINIRKKPGGGLHAPPACLFKGKHDFFLLLIGSLEVSRRRGGDTNDRSCLVRPQFLLTNGEVGEVPHPFEEPPPPFPFVGWGMISQLIAPKDSYCR